MQDNTAIVAMLFVLEELGSNVSEVADTGCELLTNAELTTSLETCLARDPKKLYQKALNGEIRSFTGIDSPYEEPENPELTLDTEALSETECVEALTEAILQRLEGDMAL